MPAGTAATAQTCSQPAWWADVIVLMEGTRGGGCMAANNQRMPRDGDSLEDQKGLLTDSYLSGGQAIVWALLPGQRAGVAVLGEVRITVCCLSGRQACTNH